VEVCPVDCFYEGENMLVIHPDECIDCGVCEPELPSGCAAPADARCNIATLCCVIFIVNTGATVSSRAEMPTPAVKGRSSS
jgi:hypothetical protein